MFLLVTKWPLDTKNLPGVYVGVAVEVLALEEEDLRLLDALLPQRLAVIHPWY